MCLNPLCVVTHVGDLNQLLDSRFESGLDSIASIWGNKLAGERALSLSLELSNKTLKKLKRKMF